MLQKNPEWIEYSIRWPGKRTTGGGEQKGALVSESSHPFCYVGNWVRKGLATCFVFSGRVWKKPQSFIIVTWKRTGKEQCISKWKKLMNRSLSFLNNFPAYRHGLMGCVWRGFLPLKTLGQSVEAADCSRCWAQMYPNLFIGCKLCLGQGDDFLPL